MKPLQFTVIFILILPLLAGCAKLAHMEQLLTLKAMSDEGDAQRQIVEAKNLLFDRMLEEYQKNQLAEYPDQVSLMNTFGEPIFADQCEENQACYEKWMYRYPTQLQKAKKIYVYFNDDGVVVKTELKEPNKGASHESN